MICRTTSAIMGTNRQVLNAITVAISLSLVSTAAQAETMLLRFGTYTRDKATTIVRSHRPIMNLLQESLTRRLGMPVKISIQVSRNYEEGARSLIEGRVDFSRFGPASYVLTKDAAPGISLLGADSKKGRTQFYGVIALPQNSTIASISDLRGRTFAFGSERSTIGRYLSQLLLIEHGIRAQDLKRFAYLGRHDRVGTAVSKRQYDAGALKEGTFKKLIKKGHKIRVLARFPNVTHAWIARPNLDSKLRQTLQAALFAITDKQALKALGRDGILAVSDSDYDVIRRAISTNDQFFSNADELTTTSAPATGK